MGKYQSLGMLKLLLRATPHKKEAALHSTIATMLCTAAAAVSHPLHHAGSVRLSLGVGAWRGVKGMATHIGHTYMYPLRSVRLRPQEHHETEIRPSLQRSK